MNALNAQQQELVVRYTRLVKAHVRRQMFRMAPTIAEREYQDMMQEGLLGLMEAASRYPAESGGPFGAYASPYIHGAICRHLTAQMDGLVIPEKVVKRILSKRRQTRQQPQPHAQGEASFLPHFFQLECTLDVLHRQVFRQYSRQQAAERGGADPDASRQACLELWERYEQAVQWAASRLKAARRCRPDRAVLVEAIVQERLLVPDVRYRTSKNALARRFVCSTSRLHQCERRMLRLVRRRLEGNGIRRASCLEVVGRSIGMAPKPVDATAGTPAPREVGRLDIANYLPQCRQGLGRLPDAERAVR